MFMHFANHDADNPTRQRPHSGYFERYIHGLRVIFSDDEDHRAQSRRNVLAATTLSNVVLGATSGIFYTGLLRIVLADESAAVLNEYLGLLVSFNLLFRMAQFLAPYFAKLFSSWRAFVFFSKLCFALIECVIICAVPFLPVAPIAKARLIVALVSLAQIAASLPSPLISIWHIGNVPPQMRTNWFAAQSMVNSVCTMCASLLYSYCIDQFKLHGVELYGLILIRILSLIPASFEMRAYLKIRLPENAPLEQPPSILSALRVFWRSTPYICITLLCAIWGFIAAVPGQYYTNYLLGDLGFEYTLISVCTVSYLPFMLVMMPFWARRIQRCGMFPVLGRVLLLYLIPYAMYLFTMQRMSYLYVSGVMIVHCISPANSLVFANLPYQKLPIQQQVGCIALHNGVCFLASFLGSLCGKEFMLLIDGKVINLPIGSIGGEQMLYGVCMIFLVILKLNEKRFNPPKQREVFYCKRILCKVRDIRLHDIVVLGKRERRIERLPVIKQYGAVILRRALFEFSTRSVINIPIGFGKNLSVRIDNYIPFREKEIQQKQQRVAGQKTVDIHF